MVQTCLPRAMSSSGLRLELTGTSNERTDEADEPPFRAISRTNEGTRSPPTARCLLSLAGELSGSEGLARGAETSTARKGGWGSLLHLALTISFFLGWFLHLSKPPNAEKMGT